MWKKPRLGVRVGEPGGAHLRLGWVRLFWAKRVGQVTIGNGGPLKSLSFRSELLIQMRNF